MKYFTNELWTQMNQGCAHEAEKANNEWSENSKAYAEHYPSLQERLSRKVYEHFKTNGFHDYRLKKLEVKHSEYGVLNPVEVSITMTNNIEEWKVTFKKIKKLELRFECGESDFEQRRGFDDWGYNEILIVDDDTLSFEILFASGAMILVHFKNKNMYLEKV
ncbi:hypothetical protein QFZ81_001004 [Paenibacillus sp. V4I9]|uniref:DUF4085 family protein n=1 Tax=Paenibacillus sp. V4I9 TaxID=3042308 RepID=UPI0027800A94|nr:DUF4085 family protein [Paenibacillus sp. V4I9]MDQ0885916.1 hypothetical protein [Paenibacillus sp. V4I9]